MDIHPKLTIEGASRLTPIPAAEATMIVITMNTRAKYTEKKEVYQIYSVDAMSLPATPSGGRREFNFPESTVSFDSYRDSSNVGGEVYRYYICGIRDASTQAIIAVETNYTQLATFCAAHPEKRDTFLKLKKGDKLPPPAEWKL